MASAVTLPAVCATTECVAKGFPSCSQGVCLHCVTENVWAIKTVWKGYTIAFYLHSAKNTQDRADFTNIRKNTDYCSSPTVTFPSVGAPGTFSPGSPLHLSSCERGVTCLHLSVLACQQGSARLHSWTSNYCIDLHVFMILFKEGSTLSVQFILNRLLHNM